jgi:hypothetical protein
MASRRSGMALIQTSSKVLVNTDMLLYVYVKNQRLVARLNDGSLLDILGEVPTEEQVKQILGKLSGGEL